MKQNCIQSLDGRLLFIKTPSFFMPGPHLLLDREMRRTTDSRAPNETEREADQAEIVDRCGEVPNADREKSNHQESRFMIASISGFTLRR